MLIVPNSWKNVLDETVVSNCGIKVQGNGLTFLFNEDNISHFKIVSRNKLVCEKIPTDDCEIDIIDWSSFSSTKQTYMMTKGNIVKIGYELGGYTTTNYKVLQIEDIKVDTKTNTAKLKLCSLFKYMTSTNKIDRNRTWAERIQLQSIAGPYGIRIRNVAVGISVTVNTDPTTLVQTLSCGIEKVTNYTSSLQVYNYLNVYDWNEYVDEDKSDIVIYGREPGPGFILPFYTEEKSNVDPYECYEIQDIDMVYLKYDLQGTNDPTPTSNWTNIETVYPEDMVAFGLNGFYDEQSPTPSYYSYRIGIYSYALTMTTVPENINTHYIQTPYLETGSAELTTAQNTMRDYYGKNTMIELEGRIDPRFEPLDTVMVGGDINALLFLEEVTIEFDGAFTGKWVGRITQTLCSSPIIVSSTYSSNGNYSITIQNNNSFAVTCDFDINGTHKTTSINASTTKTITQSDISLIKIPAMLKANGSLSYDFTAKFTASGYGDSVSVVIWAKDI